MPGTANDFIGPFHRLHRHHGLVLDRDGLADVERGNRVSHPIAELEILQLLWRRRSLGQHAFAGKKRREESRRIDQVDAFVTHHVGQR